jgi:hypothetical protein
VCYQPFWAACSKTDPESLNLLQVANGRFHTSKALVVPEKVILLFQPPYCPELNPYAVGGAKPYERLWEHLKADLKWASCKTLEQLQAKVDQLLTQLTPAVIASITGDAFILDALSAQTPFKLVLKGRIRLSCCCFSKGTLEPSTSLSLFATKPSKIQAAIVAQV